MKTQKKKTIKPLFIGALAGLLIGGGAFAWQTARLQTLRTEADSERYRLQQQSASLLTRLQEKETDEKADIPSPAPGPKPGSGTLTLTEAEHPFDRISDFSGIRPSEDDDTCIAISEFSDVGAEPRPEALPGSVEAAIRERLSAPIDADMFLSELARYPHAGMRLSALCADNRTYVMLKNESGGLVQALQWVRPEASEAYFRIYPPVPTREGFFALYQHLMEPGDILITGGAIADGFGWRAYRLDQGTAAADLLEACTYFPLTAENEEPVTVDYRCDRRYRDPVEQEE